VSEKQFQKVSVCLASYNGEKFIKEQLTSILKQLSSEDEIIVSDDGSTDNTIGIVKSFEDPRIKIYHNEGEKGYTRNFENALRLSTGDVIFLSDQDDVWIEGKVKSVLKELENNTLVVTDAEVVDGELKTIYKSHFEHSGVKPGFWNNFIKTRYIGACMAFRRELLSKAMPFPKNRELCAHDYWLVLVAEFYYKVSLVKVPFLKYRRHGGNASGGGVAKSSNSSSKKIIVRSYCFFKLLGRAF